MTVPDKLRATLTRYFTLSAEANGMDEAVKALLKSTKTRFMREITPAGTAWRQSAAAMFEQRNTLFDSGTLFRSLSASVLSKNQAEVGTNVPYAPEHQRGANGQVARPFLGFSEQDVKDITIIFSKAFQKALNS